MADGLLLTRRERLRDYAARVAIVAAPSLALAAAIAAVGLAVLAGFVAAVAGAAAVAVGGDVRTRPRAVVVGLFLCAGLFVFLVVVAWLIAHPILPGS